MGISSRSGPGELPGVGGAGAGPRGADLNGRPFYHAELTVNPAWSHAELTVNPVWNTA